jgi:putative membrane protein
VNDRSRAPVRPTNKEPRSVEAANLELSSRRTGLSFQRTRLSAERTLMSVIRTALALIGFGFTLFQFFQHLRAAHVLAEGSHAAQRFGALLVAFGIVMLAAGIHYHLRFMYGLRRERSQLIEDALIHGESAYPVSMTLLVALSLLMLGVLAITSMLWHRGPL